MSTRALHASIRRLNRSTGFIVARLMLALLLVGVIALLVIPNAPTVSAQDGGGGTGDGEVDSDEAMDEGGEAAADDLDGDNERDRVASDPEGALSGPDDNGVNNNPGFVYIFSGEDDDNLVVQLKGKKGNDLFGYSVWPRTDLDLDGYNDIIIGAPADDSEDSAGQSWEGWVYVFFGPFANNTSFELTAENANLSLHSPNQYDDFFGEKVGIVEDFNGDDYPELLISALHVENDGEHERTYIISPVDGHVLFRINDSDGSTGGVDPWTVLIGDTDGDGDVDQADLDRVAAKSGYTNVLTQYDGDVDGDGDVDQDDENMVSANLGADLFGRTRDNTGICIACPDGSQPVIINGMCMCDECGDGQGCPPGTELVIYNAGQINEICICEDVNIEPCIGDTCGPGPGEDCQITITEEFEYDGDTFEFAIVGGVAHLTSKPKWEHVDWTVDAGAERITILTETEIALSFTLDAPGIVRINAVPQEGTCLGDQSLFWIGTIEDLDGDGWTNICEIGFGTDPGDHHDSPDAVVGQDSDGDGLDDIHEACDLGTNPFSIDSDFDYLADNWELTYGYDPTLNDTDDNGISDVMEDPDGDGYLNLFEYLYETSPIHDSHFPSDTDNDGVPDQCEIALGFDVDGLNTDTDNDGLPDAIEVCFTYTDPTYYDSDSDGLPDGWEFDAGGSYPSGQDSDEDGTLDGDEDFDGDGLSNFDEWLAQTDPNNPDSDGDGATDEEEVGWGTNPTDDADGGETPAPEDVITLNLSIGDYSGSHSERWLLTVGYVRLAAPGYGEVVSATRKIRRDGEHEITVTHLGTDPAHIADHGGPDPDYTATVETEAGCAVVDDPNGLLGTYQNRWPPNPASLFALDPFVRVAMINKDDPGSPSDWLNVHTRDAPIFFPLYGGSENCTADTLKLELDLLSTDAGDLTITWSNTGPHVYTPPPASTPVWEVGDLDPTPGMYTFKAVIQKGDMTCEATVELEIGVRTDHIVVVGWINPAGVTLPPAFMVSTWLLMIMPPNGLVTFSDFCNGVIGELSQNDPNPWPAPITGTDWRYIYLWGFKHASNPNPTWLIPGGDFRNNLNTGVDLTEVIAYRDGVTNYKLFNELQLKYRRPSGNQTPTGVQVLRSSRNVGTTVNPCGALQVFFLKELEGQTGPEDLAGHYTNPSSRYVGINGGSPDEGGVRALNTLSHALGLGFWENIGSQIRFDYTGTDPVEIRVQPYPTYHVFQNGRLVNTVAQAASPLAVVAQAPFPFGTVPSQFCPASTIGLCSTGFSIPPCFVTPGGRCGDAVSPPDVSSRIPPSNYTVP